MNHTHRFGIWLTSERSRSPKTGKSEDETYHAIDDGTDVLLISSPALTRSRRRLEIVRLVQVVQGVFSILGVSYTQHHDIPIMPYIFIVMASMSMGYLWSSGRPTKVPRLETNDV